MRKLCPEKISVAIEGFGIEPEFQCQKSRNHSGMHYYEHPVFFCEKEIEVSGLAQFGWDTRCRVAWVGDKIIMTDGQGRWQPKTKVTEINADAR